MKKRKPGACLEQPPGHVTATLRSTGFFASFRRSVFAAGLEPTVRVSAAATAGAEQAVGAAT